MFATETRNLSQNATTLHIIDHFSEIPVVGHSPLNENDVKPLAKSPGQTSISKSYEVSGKYLSECYFETSYDEEDLDFLNDFSVNHKNGIILIMTENMSEFEINYFIEHLGSRIKYIIYYNGDASLFRLSSSKGLTFVRTFSLKAAVAQSYRIAKKGQAIVLPKVDSNFDFFANVDILN